MIVHNLHAILQPCQQSNFRMSPIPKVAGAMGRMQVRAAKIANNNLRLDQRPPRPPQVFNESGTVSG